MIEKRYGKKVDDVDDTIIDITDNGEDFAWFLNDDYTDEQVGKIVQRLNEFADENEQLKSENEDMRRLINNISHQRDEFHHGARENANHVGKLEKENEELKKRNNNQYQQLTELWQIIEEENWEKLIAMKKQLKEDEERLQQEWKCYE